MKNDLLLFWEICWTGPKLSNEILPIKEITWNSTFKLLFWHAVICVEVFLKKTTQFSVVYKKFIH